MISIKSAVVTALSSSTALSTLIGDNLFFFHPDSFVDDKLPSISYFELNNTGSLYSDNEELGSSLYYQLDVWSKSSTTNIAKEIDTIMKSLDFTRSLSNDSFEKDTKIYHKSMTYKLDIQN